jgi:very-short-patch-repair endonuclease
MRKRYSGTNDEVRTAVLKSYDLTVVRFNNDEVEQNLETIRQKISSFLPKEKNSSRKKTLNVIWGWKIS